MNICCIAFRMFTLGNTTEKGKVTYASVKSQELL